MSRVKTLPLFGFLLAVTAALAATTAGALPRLTTVHSFASLPPGTNPGAGLVEGKDGNFYGTTSAGGTNGLGTVFVVTPAGTASTIYNFTSDDGATPVAALVGGRDGRLYGATSAGGSRGGGTVFAITPVGVLTTLYQFGQSAAAGQGPGGLVQGSNGLLYGTTSEAGAGGGGTVYSISPAGHLHVLHSFTSSIENQPNPHGSYPIAPLIEGRDGNFYGTTSLGGAHGIGTAFSVTPAGVLTTLCSFAVIEDGGLYNVPPGPTGPLAQGADGNFYGTTGEGGPNGSGTVFKLTPAGELTTLYCFFANGHGTAPATGLIRGTDGNFYGTTYSGTVFSITPTGTVNTLHTIAPDVSGETGPSGLVQGSDGNFYGTISGGGAFGAGSVFSVTPAGSFVSLYSFGHRGSEGSHPGAPLLQGHDGLFYSTTPQGGLYGQGTVFAMTPAGSVRTLHSFTAPDGDTADGTDPNGGLVEARRGTFLGVTMSGGVADGGTVYSVTAEGILTTLHSFENDEGSNPIGELVPGGDGYFYGTTYGGEGTVFAVNPRGSVRIVHQFVDNSETPLNKAQGTSPAAGLVVGAGGKFYGTTSQSGANGTGTVFAVTRKGSFRTLHSFAGDESDGAFPTGALAVGPDGKLYGTTPEGGSGSAGTVFSILPSGVLTTLYNFAGNGDQGNLQDGSEPSGALVLGRDGNFYGVTQGGGAHGDGTLFAISPEGSLTILHSFGSSDSDGTEPLAGLVQDTDGNFYGTTSEGGSGGEGTVYRLDTVSDSGTLVFDSSSYTMSESAGSATLTVRRNFGGAGAVMVRYATVDGTAAAGGDYIATSGELSWADQDETPRTITIPVSKRGSNQFDHRTLTLKLSAPTGGASLGNPATAALTIR